MVYDPCNGVDFYDTEAEAIAKAANDIDRCLVDDQWDEEVDEILVARVTHTVEHEDIEPPEGLEGQPWFHCVLEAVTP